MGLILIVSSQNIGYLLTSCSVVYSLSWSAQYYIGDQFIMDKIDEMISTEQLVSTFVDSRLPEETKGFEVYGEKPKNANFRRKVADSFFEEEPAVDVI